MWFILTMLVGTARAECPRASSNVAVSDGIRAAEGALASGEGEAFGDRIALLRLSIGCLEEPIQPDLAAGFHRLRGILAYTRGQTDDAAASFLAARRLQPDGGLPVYPASHDIQTVFAKLTPVEQGGHYERPDGEPVYVDGLENGPIDPAANHLLQIPVREGATLELLVLDAGQLPPWVEITEPGPGLPRDDRRLGRILRASGAGLLAIAGGLTVANGVTAGKFGNRDRSTTVAELEDLRGQANLFAGGAVGTGLAGVGLVVTGLVL